jgi:hypothetical protein
LGPLLIALGFVAIVTFAPPPRALCSPSLKNYAYRPKIESWEGYLSLNNKMGDVLKTIRGKMLFMSLMGKFMGGKNGKMEAMGFEVSADMMTMMNGFTVLRLLTLVGGMMDVKFTKEQLLDLNAQLNKIKAKE